jgi:hypothetical protein
VAPTGVFLLSIEAVSFLYTLLLLIQQLSMWLQLSKLLQLSMLLKLVKTTRPNLLGQKQQDSCRPQG